MTGPEPEAAQRPEQARRPRGQALPLLFLALAGVLGPAAAVHDQAAEVPGLILPDLPEES